MGWARGSQQHLLFLKIDFERAYDRIDWLIITEMLLYLGFRSKYVSIVNTLFS
jgi:hypothetical protein